MKSLLPRNFFISAASLLSVAASVTSYAMEIWPPASDVTDENILIVKDVRMPRNTTVINAQAPFDLLVSLDQDVKIKGNECGESRLLIQTNASEGNGESSVTFDVTAFDLAFEGQSEDDSFTVESNGSGNVFFNIDNDHDLVFEPAG